MNCPSCGKEMELGCLMGGAPTLWTKQEHKKTLLCGREDVAVIDGKFPEAYLCRACRKLIVNY